MYTLIDSMYVRLCQHLSHIHTYIQSYLPRETKCPDKELAIDCLSFSPSQYVIALRTAKCPYCVFARSSIFGTIAKKHEHIHTLL